MADVHADARHDGHRPTEGEGDAKHQPHPKPPVPVRIGLLGTGWGLRSQLPAFRASGFTVAALWGRTAAKANAIASEQGIPHSTADPYELSTHKDVDFVVVTTPPHLHAEVSVRALHNGKHVLCDKPTALDQTEAARMVLAARANPRQLAVLDHELRFLPAFRKMRELIRSGYVGDVMVIDARLAMGPLIRGDYSWMCDTDMGGGALGALGTHIFDVLSFVTGLRAMSVHGVLGTYVRHTDHIRGYRHITSDDYCSVQLKYPGGILATISLNTHMPGKFVQEISIVGSAGRLITRGSNLYGAHGSNQEELLVDEASQESPFVVATRYFFDALGAFFRANPHICTTAPPQAMPSTPMGSSGVPSSVTTPTAMSPSPSAHSAAVLVPTPAPGNLNPTAAAIDYSALEGVSTFEDGLYTQVCVDAVKRSSLCGLWVPIRHELLHHAEAGGPFWGQWASDMPSASGGSFGHK
eukprot:Opistho-1_new@98580